MIKLNNFEQSIDSFPDGTLLMKVYPNFSECESITIHWHYENDRELVALIYLVKYLREHGVKEISLSMPYIPNARQDRVKNVEDVFTLKYFAEVINSLEFASVEVLDPHSPVSEVLINNLKVRSPKTYVEKALSKIVNTEGKMPLMFYPDEGACKRYSGMVDLPFAYGIKVRDWSTGKILGLDIGGAKEEIAGKNILIVDDICSKGGTFYHAAKKLKELGAKHVYLYVTHCENTILSGELINSYLLTKVFTTDSIFTNHHPLIEVIK